MNASPESILNAHDGPITDLSWSKEGNLLSSGLDSKVILWKLDKEVPWIIFTHPDLVNACKFSIKTPQFFVTACKDNLMRLFETNANRPICFYQLPMNATCLEFSLDGSALAVGLIKGEVLIYSVKENCRLRFTHRILCKNSRGFYSNGRRVISLSFLSTNFLLVSTADSRIRIMKFDEESKLVHKFKGHKNTSFIPAMYVRSDDYVMSGSENGKIYFWKIQNDKNKQKDYESIEFRKRKNPEFAVLAPKKLYESISAKCSDGPINDVIFTIGNKNKLNILLILSQTI